VRSGRLHTPDFEGLTRLINLTRLDLSGMSWLRDAHIADALLRAPGPLRWLSLAGTDVGDLTAQYIGEAMFSDGLEHLDLSDCSTGWLKLTVGLPKLRWFAANSTSIKPKVRCSFLFRWPIAVESRLLVNRVATFLLNDCNLTRLPCFCVRSR
jgi:hypothetical protein